MLTNQFWEKSQGDAAPQVRAADAAVGKLLNSLVDNITHIVDVAIPRATNKCSSDYLWVHLIRNKTQTKRSVLEDLRRLRIALAAADTGKSANGDDLAFAVPFIKLVPKPNAPLLHCPALMAVITPVQGGLPTDNVKLLMQLR